MNELDRERAEMIEQITEINVAKEELEQNLEKRGQLIVDFLYFDKRAKISKRKITENIQEYWKKT